MEAMREHFSLARARLEASLEHRGEDEPAPARSAPVGA